MSAAPYHGFPQPRSKISRVRLTTFRRLLQVTGQEPRLSELAAAMVERAEFRLGSRWRPASASWSKGLKVGPKSTAREVHVVVGNSERHKTPAAPPPS